MYFFLGCAQADVWETIYAKCLQHISSPTRGSLNETPQWQLCERVGLCVHQVPSLSWREVSRQSSGPRWIPPYSALHPESYCLVAVPA